MWRRSPAPAASPERSAAAPGGWEGIEVDGGPAVRGRREAVGAGERRRRAAAGDRRSRGGRMRGGRRGAAGRSRRGCRGRRRARRGSPCAAASRPRPRYVAISEPQRTLTASPRRGRAPVKVTRPGHAARTTAPGRAETSMPRRWPRRERRARGDVERTDDRTAQRPAPRGSCRPAAPRGITRTSTVTHAKASEARTMGCGRGGIGRRYGRGARLRPAARDLLQSLREAATVRACAAATSGRSSCDTTQAARRGQSG